MPEDRLQSTFTDALTGTLPPLELMDLQYLSALQQISEWLAGSTIKIPSIGIIRSRIALGELLQPFKHLTGKYEDGLFVEYFRGRESELSMLRAYAGVAPPRGALEHVNRFFQEYVESILNWDTKPPLLLYGLGGTGKSTLLAKFLLDHAEAHEMDKFPFVYLDFDRQILDALQPETLLIEAARQLSIQYDGIGGAGNIFLGFYNTWKDRAVSSSIDANFSTISLTGTTTTTTIRENRGQIIHEFVDLLQDFSNISKRPFLMVIDTFEEVQYRGQDCVEDLYDYLLSLQKAYPLLRLVVSGRSPVSAIKVQAIELLELDKNAATGYLAKNGITKKRTVDSIISMVGGNPLSLKLAVEIVNKIGEEELSNIKVAGTTFGIFKKRFPHMQVQAILYKRILGHIHNKQVKKLAHPGLILRLLNADLIYQVLNEPCDLNLTSFEKADGLFEEMKKEVSLVTSVDNRTIRHRPDIRKVMLTLINKDQPKLVKLIHKRAISYYERQSDHLSRAEEIYHRLSLNESHEVLDERWIAGLEQYLAGIIDELPSRAQAYLAGRTDFPVEDTIIWDKENFEVSQKRIIRKAVNLLNAGQADKVLNMFSSVKENVDKSGVMVLIKARAQLQLYDTKAALTTINEALASLNLSRLDLTIANELVRIRSEIEKGNYDKDVSKPPDDQQQFPDSEDFSFSLK